MRTIGILGLVLVVLGYLALVWDLPAEPGSISRFATAQPSDWVRTRQGWEKRSDWQPPPPVYQPAIHPMVLAGMQLCLSFAALLAFPAQKLEASSEVATEKSC